MGPDIEKDQRVQQIRTDSPDDPERDPPSTTIAHKSRYEKWAENISGLEVRGIEPIPLEERREPTAWAALEMLVMWFSMGMAINNITAGSMGTLVMGLSYKDAVICAVFGNLLGNVTVGYMSTWGPRSGNRTLVRCPKISARCKADCYRLWRAILWDTIRARCAVCSIS